MDSTPTTSPFPEPRRHPRTRGFTLVELIVSSTLSGIVLAGVLSAVLMITRSGYLLNNYMEMEQQARTALETFAVDARVTDSVTWSRASDSEPLSAITLTPPADSGAPIPVTYTYSAAAGTLSRTASGATRVLMSGIESLSFTAYKYAEPGTHIAIDASASTLTSLQNNTKMVQISLSAVRSRSALADATNNVVSARYVLRNKIQTN